MPRFSIDAEAVYTDHSGEQEFACYERVYEAPSPLEALRQVEDTVTALAQFEFGVSDLDEVRLLRIEGMEVVPDELIEDFIMRAENDPRLLEDLLPYDPPPDLQIPMPFMAAEALGATA